MKLAVNEVSPETEMSKPPISNSDSDMSEKPSISGIFSGYADVASMNGVPIIRASKTVIVKTIWTFLLLTAIGAMTFHLYTLVDKYVSFAKHSEIDMTFSNLPFPAVTICNANIMRMSQLGNASTEIQDLVNTVNAKIDALDAATTVEGADAVDDNWNLNETDEYYEPDYVYPDTEQTNDTQEVDTSLFSKAEDNFQSFFGELDVETQGKLGHQIEDLLVECTFTRKPCRSFRNFTKITTPSYGNCYTIENNKFLSRKSGPDGGLELLLFLELEEYLDGITSGRGAQVVIHGQGTYPFADEDGISIPAGQNTIISLKQLKINRLGQPYNQCTQDSNGPGSFSYTRSLCQRQCLLKEIVKNCSCYDQEYKNMNTMLNVSSTVKPCSGKEQSKCRASLTSRFKDDDFGCPCYNPCSESIYEKSISSKQWPSTAMAKYLLTKACKGKPDVCDTLWALTPDELRQNFIKLNIYYQDLNYEERSEQANYEFTQFISDIGGTIGLWIGLSVLSLCELFDVLLQIIHYLACRRRG